MQHPVTLIVTVSRVYPAQIFHVHRDYPHQLIGTVKLAAALFHYILIAAHVQQTSQRVSDLIVRYRIIIQYMAALFIYGERRISQPHYIVPVKKCARIAVTQHSIAVIDMPEMQAVDYESHRLVPLFKYRRQKFMPIEARTARHCACSVPSAVRNVYRF